jgi:hypothetical protein
MISPLSQQFFKLVEGIRLDANGLSTALLNHTKNARQFVDFVLANVDVLLDAVDWTSFEIIVRIQNPARVNHQINWN